MDFPIVRHWNWTQRYSSILATTSGSHLPVRVTFTFQRVRLHGWVIIMFCYETTSYAYPAQLCMPLFLLITLVHIVGLRSIFDNRPIDGLVNGFDTKSIPMFLLSSQRSANTQWMYCLQTINVCVKVCTFWFRIAHLHPVPAAGATSPHSQSTLGSCMYIGV